MSTLIEIIEQVAPIEIIIGLAFVMAISIFWWNWNGHRIMSRIKYGHLFDKNGKHFTEWELPKKEGGI